MLLTGKTAVVTGALQGIGKETMMAFSKQGANFIVCCQYEDSGFINLVEELNNVYNIDMIPLCFDFTDESPIKEAVKIIQKMKLQIDIIANISDVTSDSLFSIMLMEQLQKAFIINFSFQMLFMQYISRLMFCQKKGSIINISSISGIDGNRGQLAYGSSKAALIAATKTLSIELGVNGIRVNAVAPAVIETSMTDLLSDDVVCLKVKRTALKRKGHPEEVANVLVWLASDAASHVAGMVIRIDDGIF